MGRTVVVLSLSCVVFGCERGELRLLPVSNELGSSSDAAAAPDHAVASSRADGGRQFGSAFDCSSDLECGGRRPRCDLRTRRCVECLQAGDCQRPSICETSTERCVLPCVSDADCSRSSQTRCDLSRNICVSCLTNDQCFAPTPYCNQSIGECVECLDSSQCPAPWRFCTTFRNECVECFNDQDCPSGQTCGGGRCYTRQTSSSPSP